MKVTATMPTIPTLPSDLAALVTDARWTAITSGASDATVWRLDQPLSDHKATPDTQLKKQNDFEVQLKPLKVPLSNALGQGDLGGGEPVLTRFLKIAPLTSPSLLSAEQQRLVWAKDYLPVPTVVYFGQDTDNAYLLTEALAGVMPYNVQLDLTTEERLVLLAQAARLIHDLPVETCPFVASIDVKFELIRARIAADAVQMWRFAETNPQRSLGRWRFAETNPQRSLDSLYAELIAQRPNAEDIVVTHGDLYPVNVLVNTETKQLSGFVDVGRLGLADRYTDIALIANTILWHFDESWLPTFFKAYGITTIDTDKLAYYQFLDRFF